MSEHCNGVLKPVEFRGRRADIDWRVICPVVFVFFAAQAIAASPPLQGGVEERVQEDRQEPSRRAQPHVLCSAFLAAVPPGGRLHVFPKTAGGKVPLPQGGPLEERCDPPGSSALRLVGEDRNYCCFVQSADDTPGPVIDVVDDPPPEIGVHDDPPRVPPGVPPADQPPAGSPGPDRGYWAGVQSGFRNCGESVQVMIQALQAMAVGDFKRAAQLLGATDSGAGLRSLWQEIAGTQVIDMGGRRLTQFEIGERQARRNQPVIDELVVRTHVAAEAQFGPRLGVVSGIKAGGDIVRTLATHRDVFGKPVFGTSVAGLAANPVFQSKLSLTLRFRNVVCVAGKALS